MAKVLICDDAVFMRETIRDSLKFAGHIVIAEAALGADAVKKYKELSPDLVTMDILMKDSGVDAIKEIIEHDPNAKIIVVSILSDQEGEVVDCIKAGAIGLVAKPIKRDVFLSEVTRVLNAPNQVSAGPISLRKN